MAKLVLFITIGIWIISLFLLIIVVSDIDPENPFKEYRIIIGIGFFIISGLTIYLYRRLKKQKAL